MPSTQSLPIDVFFLGLRILLICLLYLFLFQVLRWGMKDLRLVAPATGRNARPQYGRLVVVDPGQTGLPPGTGFTLLASTSIGRDLANTIQLNDPSVSGEHAYITWKNDRAWIENASSKNETLLNGATVGKPTAVSEGEIISMGAVRLKWTRYA
ncbi:MAG TPA: FHA domain-containing protein [Chloroflexia bacterium]|nr:FHA domain-containing protein [Chloroflexia bacterium]